MKYLRSHLTGFKTSWNDRKSLSGGNLKRCILMPLHTQKYRNVHLSLKLIKQVKYSVNFSHNLATTARILRKKKTYKMSLYRRLTWPLKWLPTTEIQSQNWPRINQHTWSLPKWITFNNVSPSIPSLHR